MKARLFRILALISFFGLMLSLTAWIILPERSDDYPTAAWLIIGVVPLLFPLRGILHGKPYTHAWASFMMLFYFAHGVGEVYSTAMKDIYPWLEVFFSTISFTAMILFIKYNAKNASKIT
jgi:uncharacterized membrane protein